jgi:hypothetical protein
MPIVYACSNCDYRITLGWLHYHAFDSGYGSETRLMCRDCCTMHVIKIALAHGMQEEIQKRVNVIIDDLGSQLYEMRRILREATHYNRHEADAVLNSLPGLFVSDVSYSAAQTILEKLERLNVVAHLDITHDVEYHEDLLFALIHRKSKEPQLREVVGEYNSKTGRLDLEKQECGFCHTRGTLISELPNSSNNPCPNCKNLSLSKIDEWRT